MRWSREAEEVAKVEEHIDYAVALWGKDRITSHHIISLSHSLEHILSYYSTIHSSVPVVTVFMCSQPDRHANFSKSVRWLKSIDTPTKSSANPFRQGTLDMNI